MLGLEDLKLRWKVVGDRGHGVARRLLLGSVTNRLIHHADRPVLVVEELGLRARLPLPRPEGGSDANHHRPDAEAAAP